MGLSNFDWVVVFRDGTSKIIKSKQTIASIIDELSSDIEIDTDTIISIIRLELSW